MGDQGMFFSSINFPAKKLIQEKKRRREYMIKEYEE
jgi:hypothetical protein